MNTNTNENTNTNTQNVGSLPTPGASVARVTSRVVKARVTPAWQALTAIAKAKQGILALNDPDVIAVLGANAYRLPTYIWEAKTKGKERIEPVRNGRLVAAYEFLDYLTTVPTPWSW